MLSTIPNLLTLFRIALIPVFVLVFYLPIEWSNRAGAAIFALAALTDWLDGYLARRLDQVSPFGAFLDPVADKLMVTIALVLLVQANPTMLLVIPVLIIIGREISISALREWMAELGASAQVQVTMIGKMKTVAQMVAIVMLVYRDPVLDLPLYTIGYVLLYIAAILTLWSMFLYLRAAWPSIIKSAIK